MGVLRTLQNRLAFGYTQSDEISLLFHQDADLFDRKLRK